MKRPGWFGPKRPGWFGPKRLGFGIGPRTWEGWVVTAVFIGAIALISRSFELTRGEVWMVNIAGLAVFLGVVFLTYKSDDD